MIRKRLAAFSGLLIVASLVAAAPVLAAAPPANDTLSNAQAISVGFSATGIDTTGATTDSDDVDINANCGAPATDASIWYTITPATDMGILLDLTGSDYSAGALVADGSGPNWNVLACAPFGVVWSATAGTTYTILVFDDQEDGAGTGGNLDISVTEAPPPPELSLTVSPQGQFNSKTGSATVHGTITCTGSPEFSFIDVTMRQKVGRLFIDGEGFIEGFACDGSTQTWSVDIFPFNGIFKGGRTATVTFASACDAFQCGDGFAETIVKLSASKKK
jgi:hypothetical protein